MKINTNERDGWIWSLWSQMRQKHPRRMRVVETLPLGGKRSLFLVECEGKTFFVGCGGDAVNCIYPAPCNSVLSQDSTSSQPGEEITQCTL
jgi:flagellar biogenesis protein FliO